jgi:hypothetical protein
LLIDTCALVRACHRICGGGEQSCSSTLPRHWLLAVLQTNRTDRPTQVTATRRTPQQNFRKM